MTTRKTLNSAVYIAIAMTISAGSSGADVIIVERAGGMDSAGKDPTNIYGTGWPAINERGLTATLDYGNRVDSLETRAGVVAASVSASRADIAVGKIRADAAQARADVALDQANALLVEANQNYILAVAANDNALAAKTAADGGLSDANIAETAANTAALNAYWAESGVNGARQLNQQAIDRMAITEAALVTARTNRDNAFLNVELAEAASILTAAKVVQAQSDADSGNAASLTATNDSLIAKADADAAFARSEEAMALGLEALGYVPKHASGVVRKAGGGKMVVDSEYATLSNMAHQATSDGGRAVSNNTAANFKSSITFVSSVFKGNYTLENVVYGAASGQQAKLIVNNVLAGTADIPTDSTGKVSFTGVSIGFGDTVTIEYNSGEFGGAVTSDTVALCDISAGATCAL